MPPVMPRTRCFPASSAVANESLRQSVVYLYSLARAAHAPQLVEHEQDRTDRDRAVGEIERRPVPRAHVKIEKVDHMAVRQPVDHIAECATQNQRERRAEHLLPA